MHSPANETLGIQAEDLADGSTRLVLEAHDGLRSEGGRIHGGIHALLLDGAMGRSVERTLEPDEQCATVQLSVQFLAAAGTERLTATGRVVRRGRSAAFAEAECVRGDGTLVARAHGTWVIRR